MEEETVMVERYIKQTDMFLVAMKSFLTFLKF